MLRSLALGIAALGLAGAAHGQVAPASQSPNSAEMTAIFRADQDARKNISTIDWTKVSAADAERRRRTKALLDSGALTSGDDFRHAAFIFQHGGTSEDYLLAHTLAIVAVARGRKDATYIAAASLDRYLHEIGREQIYGTQLSWRDKEPASHGAFNKTLVSDALRTALGVPRMAELERQLAETDAERGLGAK